MEKELKKQPFPEGAVRPKVIETDDHDHYWEYIGDDGDLKEYKCKFCNHGKSLRKEFIVKDGKIYESTTTARKQNK